MDGSRRSAEKCAKDFGRGSGDGNVCCTSEGELQGGGSCREDGSFHPVRLQMEAVRCLMEVQVRWRISKWRNQVLPWRG